MDAINKLYLDTNRGKLETIKNGAIKNLHVSQMRKIMIEEFNPGYGPVNESDFDSVAKLMVDLYQAYDQRLQTNSLLKTQQ